MNKLSINKYKQSSIGGSAENPHQLVAAIFKQLLGNIAAAKGAILQKNIEQRNKLINKASSLIAVLEDSLDFDNGGNCLQTLQLFMNIVQFYYLKLTLKMIKKN